MDTGIQELFKKYHQINISNLIDYTPYLLMEKPIKSKKLTNLFSKTLSNASKIAYYTISNKAMMRIKYPLIREGELKNAFTATVYNNLGNLILCSYGVIVAVDDKKYVRILEGAINEDIYENPNVFEFHPEPKRGLVDMLNLN